jgi:predicted alpha/beta-fold hydrolase
MELGLPPFRQRWPWWGGDLQTLRDTLRPPRLPPDRGRALTIGLADGAQLLAQLDAPLSGEPRALVLLLHGLGGSSMREGLRRMGLTLQAAGFAVLRLNLRGAGAGRPLAPGTYAAACNSDLRPALARARELAAGRPLYGVGISLGGTMLLNACRVEAAPGSGGGSTGGLGGGSGGVLDGLVCTSSPLDLAACAGSIERPRNRLYQRWLLARLCEQTLADPFGISAAERSGLRGPARPRTIRGFDALITAPRWGYASVEAYYRQASPLEPLQAGTLPLPPTLLLQALDDPWVPAAAAVALAAAPRELPLEVVLTPRGGHNGFHGAGDGPLSCWGDRLTAAWLAQRAATSGV